MNNVTNSPPYYANPYAAYPAGPANSYSQPTPQVNNNLIWVQGEAGANAYLTAPNSVVWLMDSLAPRLYVKRTDSTGRPFPLEKYRLVNENEPEQMSGYVSNEDLEKRLNSFMDELNNRFVIRRQRKEQDHG